MKQRKQQQSGQAVVEYIFLLFAIVMGFLAVYNALNKAPVNLVKRMIDPIQKDYIYAYKYGHNEARGTTDGGAKMHPRLPTSGNFRIFLLP